MFGFTLIPVLIIGGLIFLGAIYYFQTTPLEKIIPKQAIPNTTVVTKDRAREIIKNMQEVQDYLKRVPNGKVEVDSELEGEYNVHIYEIKDGHTATFNWYRVSIKSGEVKSEFNP